MGEWDLEAVSVGAIDVVEADRDLRDDFQRAVAGGKDLGIDWIAQRGDQSVDSRLHFLDDQTLGRRFGLGIDLQVIPLVAENVQGIANIAGSKNADTLAHADLSLSGPQ